MADKEEVEPTEESAAAGSSDAAGSTDPLAPQDGVTRGGATAMPNSAGADDGFDEIVRGSGLQGSPVSDDAGADDAGPDGSAPGADDGLDDTAEDEALEPAGVGATAIGSGAGGLSERRPARRPKEVATPRRDQPVRPERTGPVKFVRESVGELRKVVYPTGQQLVNYFVVVLVFVLFVIAYVSLLDLGLGKAIFALFS